MPATTEGGCVALQMMRSAGLLFSTLFFAVALTRRVMADDWPSSPGYRAPLAWLRYVTL